MAKQNYTRRELLTRLVLVPALLAVPRINVWGNPSPAGKKGYVSLFDGKTLSGWHANRQKISHGTGGRWQVEKGILTGEQDPPGSGNGGILMTDKKYGDFELELDLSPDWGIDSGVFLRTNENGECFQIYVDYRDGGLIGFISTEGGKRMYIRPFYIDGILDDRGNLTGFETKPDARKEAWGSDFLRYHISPEEWKKTWKTGKWNTMRIRCTGKYPRITTWINSAMIADFDGETCPSPIYRKEMLAETLGREGYIGLQVHGGKGWKEGAKCRWKNIRIKELSQT
ncbi:MAG: DUF1080 domain-containing protein [Bacteroidales bacterium]|jgi:hypothetical protein|nr:DUF1080 domain-containing protein [Bacteroidales bacterium]